MFLFCADLSCHIIPVITHVGCTIISSTGHNMQTAGVTSREEHQWWWRPDSLHQYFPPDRDQWSLRDLEGPHLPTWCWLWTAPFLQCHAVDSSAMILTQALLWIFGSLYRGFAEPIPADTHFECHGMCTCLSLSLFMASPKGNWLLKGVTTGWSYCQRSHHFPSVVTLGKLETWCFRWAFFMVVAFSSWCYWLNSSPTSPWVCLGKTMRASVVASQWQSLAWCSLKAVVAAFQYVPLVRKVGSRFVLVKNLFSWAAVIQR